MIRSIVSQGQQRSGRQWISGLQNLHGATALNHATSHKKATFTPNIKIQHRNKSSTAFDVNSYKPKVYNGPNYEEVKQMRKEYLNPGLISFYKEPLLLVEGKMQYLWDDKGRRYLDCFGGIVTVSVGHCHPRVVAVGKEQLETLTHTSNVYYTSEVTAFAKELAQKMPSDSNLKVVYFTNSGSEANDLAILMARLYTGSNEVIALRNGYHGMSYGTMGLTAMSTWRYPVVQVQGFLHALNPDTFRGPYPREDPQAGEKYAWDVKNLIEYATPGKIAGFICETIQGIGGTIEMPPNYMKNVYKYVREAGGVCIADEVQGGFGRTGTKYWSFENQDVTPDIVTMAKGIGNGMPLAAVVTTPEIAEVMTRRIHFNTYGGNPVCCAMGREVLRVIDDENIQQNALEVGNHLIAGLMKLKQKHDIVGDVRGRGLLLGLELVKDLKTKEPAKEETARVFERVRELGVLIGKGGIYGNVFRIKPPMCFTKENADEVVHALDKALSEL